VFYADLCPFVNPSRRYGEYLGDMEYFEGDYGGYSYSDACYEYQWGYSGPEIYELATQFAKPWEVDSGAVLEVLY
jgi:hypothetical protein